MAQKENKIQPLNGKVLIKRLEEKEVKKGSIIIPDTAKEKPQQGEVIAASKKIDGKDADVKPGDIVLFGKYSGSEIEIDGVDFLIMDSTDILAIVK
jgi:chaperonin GroES